VRLFVAAELPEAAMDALVAWPPEHEALRAVPRQSLHVTLAFLGERAESVVTVVGSLLDELARPVGGLSLGQACWLPPRRPRVLAVELGGAEGLTVLQAELTEALTSSIGFAPERRRFLPHVTVARVRHRAPPDSLPELPDAGTFAATWLTLFRSHLSPKGSRYEALARASLELP
jgi:2'-5' RNA ligase